MKPLCHRDEYIYAIYIGAMKRHRISALLPESRTRKADALPGSFTSIQLYMYIIYSHTLIPWKLRKIVYFYSSFVLYYTHYRFIHSF